MCGEIEVVNRVEETNAQTRNGAHVFSFLRGTSRRRLAERRAISFAAVLNAEFIHRPVSTA